MHGQPHIKDKGLFEIIVGVLTTCHLFLQMRPHVLSFYGVMSRIRFMFLLFPQVSRNWRYESEPPLKPSPLTCYKQFGTKSIIVLMFVESQRVTYRAPARYVTKTWRVFLLNKKKPIHLSQVYCIWQVVKTRTIILNNPVFLFSNFRHVLNAVCFLLGTSTASEFYMPTFRNTLSIPSS